MVSENEVCSYKQTSFCGLNPCFSGGWSRSSFNSTWTIEQFKVLILVLVEDGLGELDKSRDFTDVHAVLILVLVEDGLGESQ